MVAPCVRQPRLPITMPKQWYSGTGMHRRSCSVRRMASPTKKPLFRMLRWVSVAPLGWPVVPEVNWMLIGSSQRSVGPSAASWLRLAGVARAARSLKLSMPSVVSSPRRITQRSCGSVRACNWPKGLAASSGAKSLTISR